MSDDDTLATVRDFKAMSKGVVMAAGAMTLVVGSVLAGVIYIRDLSNEVKDHTKWIAKQDKKAEDAERRKQWEERAARQWRGEPSATPPTEPKKGM